MSENVLSVDIIKKAEDMFSSGRVSHAVLIDGGSETLRKYTSMLIAKMTVCGENPNGFCGVCSSCRKADEDIHPDIITVKKPDDKRSFQKAQVKEIVDKAYITPNESDKKVFIISEMQNMTEESQNVLLKILEEPPQYTSFILTADTRNALISTVLSRVTRFMLDEEASREYSERAVSVAGDILKALMSRYEFDVISAGAPLDGDKALTAEVLSLLSLCLRDALCFSFAGKPLVPALAYVTDSLSSFFEKDKLLTMFNNVNMLLKQLENNPNYALLCAVLCVKLKASE